MTTQRRFILILAALILSSCSNGKSQSAATSDQKVHYEAVNDNGEFISHQTFDDESIDKTDALQKMSVPSEVLPLVNPDPRNRVSLVFVGDGYTQAELAQYNTDVANIRNLLVAQEPFKSYANYFSMFSIQTISSTSGVSNTSSSRLGMYYNCSGVDRLLCANSTQVMKEANLAPKVDLVFALANSTKYGGAGYRVPAISTLAGRNPAAVELAIHEMGHSFADLADEYEDAGTGVGCDAKTDISTVSESVMLSKKTKWYRWLDLTNVGTFAGGCYSTKYYRPTLNSKMRSLGRPFEEVNLEQMIISIYKHVEPIEFATPTGKIKKTTVVQVVPMKPVGRSLTLEWYLNDVLQPQLTGLGSVNPSQLILKSGTNYLKAKVTDNTTAVRDETARAQYMTETLQWSFKR